MTDLFIIDQYASDKNLTLRIDGGTRRSNIHISYSFTEFEQKKLFPQSERPYVLRPQM